MGVFLFVVRVGGIFFSLVVRSRNLLNYFRSNIFNKKGTYYNKSSFSRGWGWSDISLRGLWNVIQVTVEVRVQEFIVSHINKIKKTHTLRIDG